jgi:hypothetical protein
MAGENAYRGERRDPFDKLRAGRRGKMVLKLYVKNF